MFDHLGFVCLGSILSNTDLILRTNITSTGGNDDGELLLGVILYTRRNCCRAFPVGVPLDFFRALFNLSIRPWVIWGNHDIIDLEGLTKKPLKLLDVNYVPLLDTRPKI